MADIYNVVRGDGVFFEGMTKEQIYELIAEMTGETVQDIDQAFITKLKEINKGNSIRLWVGTSAKYNALETREDDVLYICTDDTFVGDTNTAIIELQNKIQSNYDAVENRLDTQDGVIDEFKNTVQDQINEIWDYLNLPVKTYTFEVPYNNGYRNTLTLPDDIPIGQATTLYITLIAKSEYDAQSGSTDYFQVNLECDVNAKTEGTYNIISREILAEATYDSDFDPSAMITSVASGNVSKTLLQLTGDSWRSVDYDVVISPMISFKMQVLRTA